MSDESDILASLQSLLSNGGSPTEGPKPGSPSSPVDPDPERPISPARTQNEASQAEVIRRYEDILNSDAFTC